MRMTDRETQTADEDRIRLALGMIGAEAARADTGRETVPAPVTPVRRRYVPVLMLAAAAAAGAVTYGVLTGGSEAPAHRPVERGAQAGMTWEAVIPCSRVIAEGDVVAVRDAAESGRVVLTFAVDDWLWPARGGERIDVDVLDPASEPGSTRWKPGEHLLLSVSEFRDQYASYFEGGDIARTRAAIEPYLKRSEGRECGLTGTSRDAGK